jgi:hypothetical protein
MRLLINIVGCDHALLWCALINMVLHLSRPLDITLLTQTLTLKKKNFI